MRLTASELLASIGGVVLGGLVFAGIQWMRHEPLPDPSPINLSIALPAGHRITALAISRDGSRIVYAAEAARPGQLFVRALDGFDVSPIAGTDGARNPFFSPDGDWVGFFAAGRLRKIPVAGGVAQDLCDAPMDSGGGSWGDDGAIVFAPLRGAGLQRVPAGGGAVSAVTRVDPKAGELAHAWPQVLPGNAGLLLTVARKDRDARLAVLRAGSSSPQLLVPANGPASYLSTPNGGSIVYTLGGELLAVTFDPGDMAMKGAPVSLMKGVLSTFRGYDATGSAMFALAPGGTLAFAPGAHGDPVNAPVWVERDGAASGLPIPAGRHQTPRLSPDAETLAITTRSDVLSRDVWLYPVRTGTGIQFTTAGSDNHAPVWRSDMRAIAFASNRTGAQTIFSQVVGGSGAAVPLRTGSNPQVPASWSRHGRLAFYEVDEASGRDIWVREPDARERAVVATAADERSPALSPDGSRLAYVTDMSGEDEVVVRDLAGGSGEGSLVGSGSEPVWSRDGRELFYRAADRMMVWSGAGGTGGASGAGGAGGASGAGGAGGAVLFERQYEADPGGNLANYDVSPDGRRFLMLRRTDLPPELRLVLNWTHVIARRLSPKR